MRTRFPVSKSLLLWGLLILFFLPGLLGLFHPGFFVSDDGNWMVIRFSAFYDALRHGQFPVRFLPRLLNGYGYPVADFLYPLFMYLGVPIHIIGFNFITTIKIIFAFSFIFSGVFSFLWLKRLFVTRAAFVGALAYVYFPYHLYDLYKRGSIGEILALCIVPFVLWQIEKKQPFVIGIGIGLLILSHNTLALLCLPVLLIYYFLRVRRFLPIVISLLMGLGLSAFFWIPALIDKQYTVFDSKTVSASSEFFVNSSLWYLVGVVSIVGFVVFVFGIVKKQLLPLFWGSVFLVSLFLALPASQFFWHILPLTKYVQFPFRFLSIEAISISFACAYIVSNEKSKYRIYALCLIIAAILISAMPTLLPKNYQLLPDTWYSTNQDSTTVQNEYLPMWVNTVPTSKGSIAQLIKGKGNISNAFQNGSKISFAIDMEKPGVLQVNTIYYPGWEVKVDNKKVPIVYSDNFGLMQFGVPEGDHVITASFVETPLRLFADIVSLITFVGVGLLGLLQYKRK